jgi:hypothetical protein
MRLQRLGTPRRGFHDEHMWPVLLRDVGVGLELSLSRLRRGMVIGAEYD